MSEITTLLDQVAECREGALNEVFQRLHGELRALAGHRLSGRGDLTLSPTGLVNELYLKFNASESLTLANQQHFFACAATAMRQIVVDTARAAAAQKRGGEAVHVTLELEPGVVEDHTRILAIDQAMQDLLAVDAALVELVELKFFAGLSMPQIARLRQRSERSLHRDWQRARAFLHARLN